MPQFSFLRYYIASAESKYVAFDKICARKLNCLLTMKLKLYHYSGKKDILWLAWRYRIIIKKTNFYQEHDLLQIWLQHLRLRSL